MTGQIEAGLEMLGGCGLDGRETGSFWLADYPESDIDFEPFARNFRTATKSRKPLVELLPLVRAVVCSGLSAYRSGRVVLYSRTKNARGTDPRPCNAVIDFLIASGLAEGRKGYWNIDDPTLNRTSCYRGSAALVRMFPGARIGHRYYSPPEYLVELRDAHGNVVQGFRTANSARARSVAEVNRALRRANIAINGQQIRGVQYHRVYNRTWDLGGRFYHPVQTSRKEDRAFITIDGEPTVERDYRALHIALAYAKVGLPMPEGDPYTISGMSRDAVKLTSLITLNGGTRRGVRKRLIDDGLLAWAKRADELVEAFLDKHAAISDLLGTEDIGLELQHLDAEIAERVMLEMLAREAVVLGWHDSFVVQKGRADELSAVMRDAYRDIVGFDSPKVR